MGTKLTINCQPCVMCGTRKKLIVDKDGFARWRNGELIQRAMPDLNKTQREALISGVCSDECWDKLWGVEDD